MRQRKLFVGMFCCLLSLLQVQRVLANAIPEESIDLSSANVGLELKAVAAVLMDYTTGEIIFAKNAEEIRPPASTTKILTALVAVEHGQLNQIITASEKASKTDGSSIWLSTGEQHTLEDLLYGILLSSGNDASVAVAESLAGSEEKFANWMTEKAHSLGAMKSNFKNCNGLPNEEHYTTAHDLALIARQALHNPKIDEIVRTKKKVIDWPGHPWDRMMINHNKLLWRYEFTDGVKTGYTKEAGKCLISSATKNGHRLISVVLNSRDMYEDSIKLFNYGFENYQLVTLASDKIKLGTVDVLQGIETNVSVLPQRSLTVLVPRGFESKLRVNLELPSKIKAPVEREQLLGELQVHLGKRLLEKVPLVAERQISQEKPWVRFWQWVKERFSSEKLVSWFPVKFFRFS